MGLVATLREVKENTDATALNRYNPERPIVMDGSLSELVTQALNIAYSKKNITTGDPYFGNDNPTGNPPPGAGNVVNFLKPDSPNTPAPIRPTLESMQQDQHNETIHVAAMLENVINASDPRASESLREQPLLIYAIPRTGMVTEEMNSTIDMYHDSGAVDIGDFVFVYTDSKNPHEQDPYRVFDANQKLKDYEGRGARVYNDLQSFLVDLPTIRQRK